MTKDIEIMHLARTGSLYRSGVMHRGSRIVAQGATQEEADAKVVAKLSK